MQSKNLLKVFEGTLRLLGKYHQIVLELVEYISFKGLKIDDLVGLNGLDHARILKILQDLQQLGLVYPKGKISEQRWYLLEKGVRRELKLRDQSTSESEIHSKSEGGIQWKTVLKMVKKKIKTKMVNSERKNLFSVLFVGNR